MIGKTPLGSAFAWPFTRRITEIPDMIQNYLDAPRPDDRAPWREIPYSVLDIETTGLNARRDAILSIGLIDIDDGRVRLDRQWYTLVRPPEHVNASPESIRIHGLLHTDVADAPPATDILPELLKRLLGRVLIVHYAPIDVDFLNHTLRQQWSVGLRGPAIDTMRLAETLHHYQRWTAGNNGNNATALGPLAAQAGIPVHTQHNALGDALTTAQLFLAQATRMESLGNDSLRTLLKAGRCLR